MADDFEFCQVMSSTLPETNSSHLKMDGWNTGGELLVSGSVIKHQFQVPILCMDRQGIPRGIGLQIIRSQTAVSVKGVGLSNLRVHSRAPKS